MCLSFSYLAHEALNSNRLEGKSDCLDLLICESESCFAVASLGHQAGTFGDSEG